MSSLIAQLCCSSIWYLNIYETYVIANNSTKNNVLFFVSDLKIVYYNNY